MQDECKELQDTLHLDSRINISPHLLCPCIYILVFFFTLSRVKLLICLTENPSEPQPWIYENMEATQAEFLFWPQSMWFYPFHLRGLPSPMVGPGPRQGASAHSCPQPYSQSFNLDPKTHATAFLKMGSLQHLTNRPSSMTPSTGR